MRSRGAALLRRDRCPKLGQTIAAALDERGDVGVSSLVSILGDHEVGERQAELEHRLLQYAAGELVLMRSDGDAPANEIHLESGCNPAELQGDPLLAQFSRSR